MPFNCSIIKLKYFKKLNKIFCQIFLFILKILNFQEIYIKIKTTYFFFTNFVYRLYVYSRSCVEARAVTLVECVNNK